jgi:hypothetical protein
VTCRPFLRPPALVSPNRLKEKEHLPPSPVEPAKGTGLWTRRQSREHASGGQLGSAALLARVVALSLASRQECVLAEDREIRGGFDMGADYVYWSEAGSTESAMVRAPE